MERKRSWPAGEPRGEAVRSAWGACHNGAGWSERAGRKECGEEFLYGNIPVSHICSRTTVSVSVSTTRLVMKEAPTVEVICEGLKAPLQNLVTSDVLPTP